MIPPPFTYKGYRIQALWELARSPVGYYGVARITRSSIAVTELRTATSHDRSDDAVRHAEGLARTWVDEQE